MKPQTRADVIAGAAIVTAFAAVYQTWRGNAVAAVVAALNGITIALVSLGVRMAAK